MKYLLITVKLIGKIDTVVSRKRMSVLTENLRYFILLYSYIVILEIILLPRIQKEAKVTLMKKSHHEVTLMSV